jgi:hypothetical protein
MEQKDYIHRIISSISVENSLKLTQAVFEESLRREATGNPMKPGFSLGYQTARRTRMYIPLHEFRENTLLMHVYKKNLKIIWKKNSGFARNFRPNVLLCFLVEPGGSLRSHKNEVTSSQPFIAVWSFGCSITYQLRRYRKKSDNKGQTNELSTTSEIEFNFKSQDFLMIDGVKVKHGYKECEKETFYSECKIPLLFPQIGVTGEYRLGLVLIQFDNIDEVPIFFYNGKPHSQPKLG